MYINQAGSEVKEKGHSRSIHRKEVGGWGAEGRGLRFC